MARPRVRYGPPILLFASLVAGGCATGQKSLVVLLPEEENSSAAVKVTNARGSQVLTAPFQATVVAANRAPAAPITLDEATVQREFGEALSAMPSPPVRFVLYFESDSTELTAESKQLLPQVLETVAKRQPAEVAVVGHTDTQGAPERNFKLGLDRAEKVAELLKTLGIPPATLEVSSHGEADLLVPTADEVAEPRNRCVEVTVR